MNWICKLVGSTSELKEYLKKTGGTVEGDINVKGNLSTTNLRIHEADVALEDKKCQ